MNGLILQVCCEIYDESEYLILRWYTVVYYSVSASKKQETLVGSRNSISQTPTKSSTQKSLGRGNLLL